MNKNPDEITVSKDSFGGSVYQNTTLKVPVGTGYAYRHHPVFRNFKDIRAEITLDE